MTRILKIRKTFKQLPVIFEDDEYDDDTSSDEHTQISQNTDDDILKGFLAITPKTLDPSEYDEKKKKEKKPKKKKKKKKEKGLKNFDDLNLFGDEETPEEKKKRKESDDFYEYRFNGSLKLLTNLMQEVNISTNEAKEYLNKMKIGKVKASPASITNQTSNISTLLGTKLSVIKEITAVNSKISELELKKSAANEKSGKGKESEALNQKLMMDKMFDRLLAEDTKIVTVSDGDNDELISDGSDYNNASISQTLDERIKELEESGDIEFNENERAFKYERDNVQVCVKKNINNNRWEFVALNADGDELYDYPCPSKRSIGKMKFDMDNLIATDSMKREYHIIPVESLNPDDTEMRSGGSHRGVIDDNYELEDDDFNF